MSLQLSIKQIQPSGSKITMLLWELSNNESDDNTYPLAVVSDPKKPWLKEYNLYIDVRDELTKGQSIVQLWGISISTTMIA